MAATRTALKEYFKKYATPTEEQFAALIDAFVHKDEDSLTQSKIDGLTAALESKVSSSDLASAVASAVEALLEGGDIEVTPAAHQHAIADVEGLQAFVTKVNNFLESADVSDETINRWAEIETFLTGITDQETLAGLLLNLKNEILAQIPEPQTGNYLKQISDLDAYTTAQEGEIVQYVGSTTAKYTRGYCYEWKNGEPLVIPITNVIQLVNLHKSAGEDVNFGDDLTFYEIDRNEAEPKYSDLANRVYAIPLTVGKHMIGYEIKSVTIQDDGTIDVRYGDNYGDVIPDNETVATKVYRNSSGIIAIIHASMMSFGDNPITQNQSCSVYILDDTKHDCISSYYAENFITRRTTQETIIGTPSTWQPIVTSPAVS